MKESLVASSQSPASKSPVRDFREELAESRGTWLTNVWFRVGSYRRTGNWELETGNGVSPWA